MVFEPAVCTMCGRKNIDHTEAELQECYARRN